MPDDEIDIFKVEGDEADRQFIRNLVDSYSHDWDTLAELCQNAIDALRAKESATGSVHVTFDKTSNSLQVEDSGVGMNRDVLAKALCPNVTFKRGKARLIGEKGLGLTFCAFQTNELTIESSTGDGEIHTAVFRDAKKWLQGAQPGRPLLQLSTRSGQSKSYTRVSARDVSGDFSVESSRIIHILRTRTALGCTYPQWPQTKSLAGNIEVKLTIISADTGTVTKILPFEYWHPADHIAHKKTLSEIQELARNNKMRDFKGWGLVDKREMTLSGGRKAFFHTLMLSVPEYDKLADSYQLLKRYKIRVKEADQTNTEVTRPDEPGDAEPGIYLSVKGMPTGISLPFPTGTTEAGYWNNFYFLIEADWLTFDAGRKVVPGRTQEVIKRACKTIWTDLLTWKARFIGHESEDTVDQFAETQKQQARLDRVRSYHDLALGKVPFAKEPQTEQATIALFHEIVGRGLLKGYQTLDINTAATYDSVMRYSLAGTDVPGQALQIWRNRMAKPSLSSIDYFPLNAEFKWEASDILDDFSDRTKYLEHIDLIICWTCDVATFESAGVFVQSVDREAELFNGASKRLEFGSSFSSQRHVYLIVLSELVERLESEA
jgi:hypothetical protein